MPRMKLPFFQNVSNLHRIPIFVSKMSKRPMVPKLIFLRKPRKLSRFNLLKHSKKQQAYVFLKEFEFSPSSTPLIQNYRKKMLENNASYKKYNLYSMLLQCTCLGGWKADVGGDHVVDYRMSMDQSQPAAIAGEYLQPLDYFSVDQEEEEDSVDQRAEQFIQKFYQEMRRQRRESI